MKAEFSVEIAGVRASLVFEVLPEGSAFLCEDPQDPSSSPDNEWEAYREGFHSIRIPDSAQRELLRMHDELYRSLVISALGRLRKVDE